MMAENKFYLNQKMAENEDSYSQYKLALSYQKGEGTEKNLEKAFYWYQKGAENGFRNGLLLVSKRSRKWL